MIIEQLSEQAPILGELLDAGVLGGVIFMLFKTFYWLLDYLRGRNVVEEKDQEKETVVAKTQQELVGVIGLMAESIRAIPEEMKQDREQHNTQNQQYMKRLEMNATLTQTLIDKVENSLSVAGRQLGAIHDQNSELVGQMTEVNELSRKLDELILQSQQSNAAIVRLEQTINSFMTGVNDTIEDVKADITSIVGEAQKLKTQVTQETAVIQESMDTNSSKPEPPHPASELPVPRPEAKKDDTDDQKTQNAQS